MASVASTEPSHPLVGQNAFVSIGVGYLDLTSQKTHAITVVTFKKSCRKAHLTYTRDHIQYGWPSVVSSPSSVNPINPLQEVPGMTLHWRTFSYAPPFNAPIRPEYYSITYDYLEKCCASVEKVKVFIDSKEMYENSLLSKAVIPACRDFFPNHKGCTLEFPVAFSSF